MMDQLILASASPRRKELLEHIGLQFKICVPDVDETQVERKNIPAELYVQELALLKAGAAAGMVGYKRNTLVIAADTVVFKDQKILGKPQDETQAKAMLRTLSGAEHAVYTGICVLRASDGFSVCKAVRTAVRFKKLTDDKISRYIRTGEPMDKAGAYGIQGYGATLVEGIEGDYFNVVGLPLAALAELLEREFGYEIF